MRLGCLFEAIGSCGPVAFFRYTAARLDKSRPVHALRRFLVIFVIPSRFGTVDSGCGKLFGVQMTIFGAAPGVYPPPFVSL